jgi:hypothetical protein
LPAWTARTAAGLIALICWGGLAFQFSATYAEDQSLLSTLWVLARFFTIISNLALAIAMSRLVLGGRVSPFVSGGLTLAILLVGIVYVVLLRGLHPLSGAALVANALLHYASPVAMAAFWLLLTPHGRLRWSAPLWWALLPVTYFAYIVARGAFDGRYPYPFIDVAKIGPGHTLINAVAIALGFIASGFGLVGLDRLLGRSRPSG